MDGALADANELCDLGDAQPAVDLRRCSAGHGLSEALGYERVEPGVNAAARAAARVSASRGSLAGVGACTCPDVATSGGLTPYDSSEGVQRCFIGVAQERPAGSESCAIHVGHRGWIDAQRHKPAVADLQFVLQGHEAPEEALLLRAPWTPIGMKDPRVASGHLRQPAPVRRVVERLEVREAVPKAGACARAGRPRGFAICRAIGTHCTD